jgi:CheY-like chemotaxis protein
LVIDDDPAVRDVLTRFLTREGFRVLAVDNGREGLRQAKHIQPDVITLDVMMPEVDGWATLNRLKNDNKTAHIPVVMLTMVQDQGIGYALGANEYLTKPLERAKLVNTLKKYSSKPTNQPIMVVEDDEVTREMVVRMLEKEGWKTIRAENGQAAVDRLGELRPELILLDLMMPIMDGFQFITEVRKHEDWRSIPIIVMTAKELTVEDRQQLNGYVRQILQKGNYSQEQLLREVRSLVSAMVTKTKASR